MNIITKAKLSWKVYQLYKEIERSTSMIGFLKSKKALALIAGLLSTVLVNILGLPEAQVADAMTAIQVLIGTYIGAQGLADGLSKGVTSSSEKESGE